MEIVVPAATAVVTGGRPESVRELLDEGCAALALTGGTFCVGGFGQLAWPVDVETDLLVVLEQLPNCIALVSAGTSCDLDFYEQGVERSIHCVPVEGGRIRLECTSPTDWVPDPMVVEVSGEYLLANWREVVLTFVRFASDRWPGIAGSKTLDDWLAGNVDD